MKNYELIKILQSMPADADVTLVLKAPKQLDGIMYKNSKDMKVTCTGDEITIQSNASSSVGYTVNIDLLEWDKETTEKYPNLPTEDVLKFWLDVDKVNVKDYEDIDQHIAEMISSYYEDRGMICLSNSFRYI